MNTLQDKLLGRIALVTGAGSGIGRATALRLSRAGAAVVLSDRQEEGVRQLAIEIQASGGKAVAIRVDVANERDCQAQVDLAVKEFGALHIAFNNAGIGGELHPTADYPLSAWNEVLAVNLTGVFLCMKSQIPAMLQAGGGSIINNSSILGSVAFAGAPAYTAAKHGVIGLTQASALEYSSQNIRVNAIGPAFIHTPMIESMEKDPSTLQQLISLHPIGRLGRPEEVANLVAFLASEESSFMTGSYIPIDGGFLAR